MFVQTDQINKQTHNMIGKLVLCFELLMFIDVPQKVSNLDL